MVKTAQRSETKILDYLLSHGPSTAKEIEHGTGLSKKTVIVRVKDMQKRGKLGMQEMRYPPHRKGIRKRVKRKFRDTNPKVRTQLERLLKNLDFKKMTREQIKTKLDAIIKLGPEYNEMIRQNRALVGEKWIELGERDLLDKPGKYYYIAY